MCLIKAGSPAALISVYAPINSMRLLTRVYGIYIYIFFYTCTGSTIIAAYVKDHFSFDTIRCSSCEILVNPAVTPARLTGKCSTPCCPDSRAVAAHKSRAQANLTVMSISGFLIHLSGRKGLDVCVSVLKLASRGWNVWRKGWTRQLKREVWKWILTCMRTWWAQLCLCLYSSRHDEEKAKPQTVCKFCSANPYWLNL